MSLILKVSVNCAIDQLLFEVQHLKIENETLSKERRMLRNELAALDKVACLWIKAADVYLGVNTIELSRIYF